MIFEMVFEWLGEGFWTRKEGRKRSEKRAGGMGEGRGIPLRFLTGPEGGPGRFWEAFGTPGTPENEALVYTRRSC